MGLCKPPDPRRGNSGEKKKTSKVSETFEVFLIITPSLWEGREGLFPLRGLGGFTNQT